MAMETADVEKSAEFLHGSPWLELVDRSREERFWMLELFSSAAIRMAICINTGLLSSDNDAVKYSFRPQNL